MCACDPYFIKSRNATGLLGLSTRKKVTATMRILALEVCVDAMDEYRRASESTIMKCMKPFCKAVRIKFESYHPCQPTREDFKKHLGINATRGFPRIFARLDLKSLYIMSEKIAM